MRRASVICCIEYDSIISIPGVKVSFYYISKKSDEKLQRNFESQGLKWRANRDCSTPSDAVTALHCDIPNRDHKGVDCSWNT